VDIGEEYFLGLFNFCKGLEKLVWGLSFEVFNDQNIKVRLGGS
jgi:hypothetical protein